MPASSLRKISGVFWRETGGSEAAGIQRRHEESRSYKIRQYVKYGYPYGDVKEAARTADMLNMRKPGWLPTAIIVNIMNPGEIRQGRTLNPIHAINLVEDNGVCSLEIPDGLPDFSAEQDILAPIEVIDGQHRLLSFDSDGNDHFQLPVVAFHGLDVGWQAYLFWSINVSPKKLNSSHAFDLYPLLRTQDWLERTGELNVYRQARAQELVDILFSLPESAWHKRINMLGVAGEGKVSQAAWIRSLTSSVLATGRGLGRPGLFQAEIPSLGRVLKWSRAQQAAFLIFFWNALKQAVAESHAAWVIALSENNQNPESTPAFEGNHTMLAQDQGMTVAMAILNDIFYNAADVWGLDDWETIVSPTSDLNLDDVKITLADIQSHAVSRYVQELSTVLSVFDWRSFNAPGLTGDEQDIKRSFRGSGGYTALRLRVLRHISEQNGSVSDIAKQILHSAPESRR